MTRGEFFAWLEDVERALPVTRWTVRGFKVWPMIRLSLSSTTFGAGSPRHGLGAPWHQRVTNVAGGARAWSRAYLGDFGANRRPTEPTDAVFLSYSTGRRPLIEGRRYDVRAGPFIDQLARLGCRSLVWELSPFGEYNTPRYTPSFLLQPTLVALRAVCQLLPLGDDRVELEGYADFVRRLRDAGLGFPHSSLMRVRRDALFVRRLADRFSIWLERSRPRLGFVANTGLVEQAFCLACRELGLVSVELQHGIQGPLHPSYASWHAVPAEGWETRAAVFWIWDRQSADTINGWGGQAPGRHVAVVGGDPWRDMWLDESSATMRAACDLVERRKREAGGEHHVLVTLSSKGPIVPPPVLEAVRASPSSWRYWFRLHQVDQAARRAAAIPLLRVAGADPSLMEFATEAPLHAMLRTLDCHVTASLSTVVLEAAAHGLPSVACQGEAADLFSDVIADGMLEVALSSAAVIDALRRFLAAGRRPVEREPVRVGAVLQWLLEGAPR